MYICTHRERHFIAQVVAYLKRTCPGHISACSMAPACIRQVCYLPLQQRLRAACRESESEGEAVNLELVARGDAGLNRCGCVLLDLPVLVACCLLLATCRELRVDDARVTC